MPAWFGHKEPIPQITPAAAQARLTAEGGACLLDVREPQEYAAGHVPGSTLIPLGQLANRIAELPRDRPILVICQSGSRSGLATQLLQRQGFGDVSNIQGGIMAWQRGGGPLQRGS